MIFTGGLIGWNADAEVRDRRFRRQVAQKVLRNIVAVLAEGGAKPEHIVA